MDPYSWIVIQMNHLYHDPLNRNPLSFESKHPRFNESLIQMIVIQMIPLNHDPSIRGP